MKPNLFLIFYLVLVALFPIFSQEKSTSRKGFLINVNGIKLFSSKGNLQGKTSILKYGEEVEILNNKQDSTWLEIRHGKMIGFIPQTEISKSDFLIFSNPINQSYSVLRKNQNLTLKKPVSDSIEIETLPQFSVVEVLEVGLDHTDKIDFENVKWYYISFNGKKGYIKDSIKIYPSLNEAKKIAKNKVLDINGLVMVTNAKYVKDPDKEIKMDDKELKGASKKGEFLFVKESMQIKEIIYFKTEMQNPSRFYKMQANPTNFNDTPLIAWISTKDVTYFTNIDYSRYTIEHSNYKGNKNVMEEILSQNVAIPLDFTNFSLTRLPRTNQKEKSNFFLARLFEGYVNAKRFGNSNELLLIVKEENNKFTVFAGNLNNRGKMEYLDLDDDGIPEIYTHMDVFSEARVAYASPAFFGYVDGKYQEISLPGQFLDDYSIEGKFLLLNKKDDSGKKNIRIKYKYKNGKFLEISNLRKGK